MGLMRALTLKRSSTSTLSTRLNALKGRPQISLPTELISTTNTLSYTAPSVESMQLKAAGPSSMFGSAADFEATTSSAAASVTESSPVFTRDFAESPVTPTTATISEANSRRSSGTSDSAPSLTDASSVSFSPRTPTHHEFTTLTSPTNGYFNINSFSKSSSRNSPLATPSDGEIDPFTVVRPALPRRAPSHSKREHERLARRRSQRVSMVIDVTAIPADDLVPAPLTAVMPELVEVAEEVEVPAVTVVEVAEECDAEKLGRLLQELVVADEERAYMRQYNLKRFSVSGYLDVVGEMWGMESYTVDDVAVVA